MSEPDAGEASERPSSASASPPSPAESSARLDELQRENAALHAAAREARLANERLRDVLAGSRVGTWDLHLASKTVVLSPTCKAIYGLPPQAEYDRDVFIGAIEPDDLGRYKGAVRAAVHGTSDLEVSYRFRRTDGEIRWAEVRGYPVDGPDGRRVALSGVVIDVTDRKRAEELAASNRQLVAQIEERERVAGTLRQMQRLEAVGQLTSGVAHDFNNLLTVIIGNLGFIQRGVAGLPAADKLLRRLGFMESAAERGAKLTAQLLAFSRRQRLEPKPIDLNGTVGNLRDLLQSTMGGAVRVETVLSQSLWPALVDPTQIELVILNLAINARDAMAVGGCLTVETGNAALRADAFRSEARRPEEPEPGEYVVVAVVDTGYGMSDEVRAKAFEPFFTTKEIGKGTGLGLSQVLGFAKQSGGGVRIDSRPGEGTAVKVFLPRAACRTRDRPGASERSCEPSASADGGGAIVLLVDDDTAVREVTAELLREAHYTVIEAGSGGAGLEMLDRAGRVDLLLVDFAMPGMNGAEVAREAQSRRPGLPTLFVTGYADLDAIRSVGEQRIVAKPFSRDRLLDAIDEALGRHQGLGRDCADGKVVPLKR